VVGVVESLTAVTPVGIPGTVPPPVPELIVIFNSLASLPAELVAFTVKVDVPAVVGNPVIVPPASINPAGNEPLSRLHVMGVVPDA
jgi:hypothetical protein